MNPLELIIGIVSSITGALALVLSKSFLDKANAKQEEKELKQEVARAAKRIQDEPKDVLTVIRRNVAELREYYTINKQQARNAFSAAVFACFLGFLLFGGGVVLSYIFPTTHGVIQYSTIAGAIVEIIGGLFFWLYSKAIKRINIFHESPHHTQQFLTAVELLDKIGHANRDKAYAYIIQSVVENTAPFHLSSVIEDEKAEKHERTT